MSTASEEVALVHHSLAYFGSYGLKIATEAIHEAARCERGAYVLAGMPPFSALYPWRTAHSWS